MSGRQKDRFAPGGREYEKNKAKKKLARRELAPRRPSALSATADGELQNHTIDQNNLTRSEREELEKQRKQEAYLKATREGKTLEGAADLERLQKIRADREAAKQKRDQMIIASEQKKLEAKQRAIRAGDRGQI